MASESTLVRIDGQQGEGGGQVLRTSATLAAALGRPLHVTSVRAGRPKPGLLRQHLTALRACAEICGGELVGATLGSSDVELHPGAIRAGSYRFAVGSAGSAMLVLQTVLPVLLLADGESEIVVEGGTHNPWAPPFEALARSFAPLLERAGCGLQLRLERAGFHPAGGGRVHALVTPPAARRPLELLERGPELERSAEAMVANLPESIGARELHGAARQLPWLADCPQRVHTLDSDGPGNIVHVTLSFRDVVEVFSAFGMRGVTAESIGRKLGKRVRRYLAADHPVGEHLADQLMLPLALLAGGRFRTGSLSRHAQTNAAVIDTFLPDAVRLDEGAAGTDVTVRGTA